MVLKIRTLPTDTESVEHEFMDHLEYTPCRTVAESLQRSPCDDQYRSGSESEPCASLCTRLETALQMKQKKSLAFT